MAASDLLKRAIGILSKEFPATFTWLGDEYTGVASTTTDTSQMREAGFMAESDIKIKIGKSEFDGAPPEAKQTITKDRVNYIIQTVTTGPDGEVLTLACNRLK